MGHDSLFVDKTNRLIVVLLSVLLLSFLALSLSFNSPVITSIDHKLLFALRDSVDVSLGWGPSWLAEFMRDMTALGSNWMLGFFSLTIAGYLWLTGKANLARYYLLVIVFGVVLSFLLKWGFSRPRPELVPHATQVYTSSFPSGHAMSSALFFLTTALLFSWRQTEPLAKYLVFFIALLVPFVVSLSRVYLGVHWPTDVLAGLCAGYSWALLCFVVTRRYVSGVFV